MRHISGQDAQSLGTQEVDGAGEGRLTLHNLQRKPWPPNLPREYRLFWLDLGSAAVDEELDAVDEAGVARGEEESDGCDLFRTAHFAAWDQ